MKVLWFTNTILPEFALAMGKAGGDYGGWMPSLLAAIRQYAPELELHIVSHGLAGMMEEIDGVHYYGLGDGRIGRGGRKLSASFAQLARKVIDEVRPDVIHVHGSEGPYADFPVEMWRNQWLVVSLQGIISAYYYYYGNLAESDLNPYRNRLRELIKGYSERASRIYWKNERSASERKLLSAASVILGRTDWDKAWATRLAPAVPYAYVGEILRETFYNGKRTGLKIVPNSIFCGASLAYPLKNGHVLLDAIYALKKKYPNIVLHVANSANVGKKPSFLGALREGEYVRYLRDQIAKLGLKGNLVLHPSLSAERVRELLERVELFCLPSACENSPNSLGEAMLTGTPSVATYAGGVPSILKNEVEGLLVPSGDPAVLAGAIDRLFTDRALAQAFVDHAYETAVKRYNPKTVVDQLLVAYDKVKGARL